MTTSMKWMGWVPGAAVLAALAWGTSGCGGTAPTPAATFGEGADPASAGADLSGGEDAGEATANQPVRQDLGAGEPNFDPELADLGAGIFVDRGCAACHSVGGGDRDGPDLEGITRRRSREWILAMLRDPVLMTQIDPDAQQMLIEHFHQMPDLELTEPEALAIHAYLARGTVRD